MTILVPQFAIKSIPEKVNVLEGVHAKGYTVNSTFRGYSWRTSTVSALPGEGSPYKLGRLGIEAAVDHLNGLELPPQLLVDLDLVTQDKLQ